MSKEPGKWEERNIGIAIVAVTMLMGVVSIPDGSVLYAGRGFKRELNLI
jgi:hypothetical protein